MWVILGFFASIFLTLALAGFSLTALFDGIVSATPAGVILVSWIVGIWVHYQYVHKPKMLKLAAQSVVPKEKLWVPEPVRIYRGKPSPGPTSVPVSSPGPKVQPKGWRLRVWRH